MTTLMLSPALGPDADAMKAIEHRSQRAGSRRHPPFNVLSAPAARAVERWRRPCEALFKVLARDFPKDLAAVISSGTLEENDLTFAAEAFGSSVAPALVREALIPLLGHPSAVVREGAIYGLQKHLDDDVRALLQAMVASDASHAVREVASDALSEM